MGRLRGEFGEVRGAGGPRARGSPTRVRVWSVCGVRPKCSKCAPRKLHFYREQVAKNESKFGPDVPEGLDNNKCESRIFLLSSNCMSNCGPRRALVHGYCPRLAYGRFRAPHQLDK